MATIMRAIACGNCNGEGYHCVGSSVIEEENEWVECEVCEASGLVEVIPF